MRFDSFETTCLLCRKVFDSVGEYLVHYKTHTHNFLCPICKQRFKAEKALFNHMKNHTEGEDRPFVCMEPTCGATFKRSAHLKSHHLNKHTAERGIQCEFCDYKCRQRGDLNIHMRWAFKFWFRLRNYCEYFTELIRICVHTLAGNASTPERCQQLWGSICSSLTKNREFTAAKLVANHSCISKNLRNTRRSMCKLDRRRVKRLA